MLDLPNYRRSLWCARIALVVAACVLSSASAWAQKYQEDEPKPGAGTPQIRALVFKIVRGEPLAGNEEAVKAYFEQWLFPQMTQLDNLGKTADLRVEFLRRYYRAAKKQELVDFLNKITIDRMKRYIAGNYHPAVRHNAALLAGELDERLGIELGAARRPPVPLDEGRKVLLVGLTHAPWPDAIKVGSLVGLERHAKFTTDAQARQAIIDAAQALAAQTEPPKGRSPEGHAWMRRSAVEILATLKQPGGVNEVVTTLAGVMNEKSAPLWLRCEAAGALGRLNYAGGAKLDELAMATDMAALAATVCGRETARARQYNEPVARSRALDCLTQIRRGMTAVRDLAGADVQTKLAGVEEALDKVIELLVDMDVQDEFLAPDLEGRNAALRAAIRDIAPAPAKPDGPDAKKREDNGLEGLDGL